MTTSQPQGPEFHSIFVSTQLMYLFMLAHHLVSYHLRVTTVHKVLTKYSLQQYPQEILNFPKVHKVYLNQSICNVNEYPHIIC